MKYLLVRVSRLSQDIFKKIFDRQLIENSMHPPDAHVEFRRTFTSALEEAAADPEVVGFKSIVCYRTGLDIAVHIETGDYFSASEQAVTMAYLKYDACRSIRVEAKPLNDYIVHQTLRIAGQCGKPGALCFYEHAAITEN